MSNLSDKDIDRLAREASEFYEPDDSMLSWNRLQKKLSEQMPERPPDRFQFGRFNPFLGGTAILLFAGISFFSIKKLTYRLKSTPTHQTIIQTENSVARQQKDLMVSKEPHAAAAHLQSLQNDKVLKTVSGEKEFSQKHDAVVYSSGSKMKSAAGKNNPDIHSIAEDQGYDRKKSNHTTRETASALAAGALIHAQNTGSNESFSNAAGSKNSETPNLNTHMQLPSLAESGAKMGRVQGNDSSLMGVHPNNPVHARMQHINRSLNFGLAFGPDYTNAGGNINEELSNNIGLTIGYYITPRLSINSGIFYSNKYYWATNKPMSPPGNLNNPGTSLRNYSTSYAISPPFENVNGACTMFEIPLTLRYDFRLDKKTKFFINGGLSTYMFRHQSYVYYFHSSARPSSWVQDDNSHINYWFGIADFSVGIEKELGKGLSFQAEPFLRIPLKEMGLQDLKLTSVGFLLSIRYSPKLGSSKK